MCLLRGTDGINFQYLAMSQGVSPLPVPAETEFRLQAKSCNILVGKVPLGQVFHRVIRFSASITFAPLLHNHLRIQALLLTEGQTDEGWKRSNKQCFFGKRKALVEKYFNFFVSI